MTALLSAADTDPELFREDLDTVKRDVASLIEHMKVAATSTVQNAACQVELACRSPPPASGSRGRPLRESAQSLC